MRKAVRNTYLRIFTIFFIIVVPFLSLFTLGYNVNLEKQEVANSLLLRTETLPRGAKLTINDANKASTPTEQSINNNTPYSVSITQNGYREERFDIFSNQSSNTTATLATIPLIPQNPSILSSLPPEIIPITLINEATILLQYQNTLYTQRFVFNGLIGDKTKVLNDDNVIISNPQQMRRIGKGYWFEKDNVYLYSKNDIWNIKSFNKLPFNIQKIITIKEDELLVLDINKSLWKLDVNTFTYQSLSTNISGLSQSKNNNILWILQGKDIYRSSLGQITSNELRADKFGTLNKLYESKSLANDFSIFEVDQGVIIKEGIKVSYLADIDNSTKTPLVLGEDIEKVFAFNNLVVLVDVKGNIMIYNLSFALERYIGVVPQEDIDYLNVYYDYHWKRLMIYSSFTLMTVWYDKDIENLPVTKYYPNTIENAHCLPAVVEKHQFCLRDSQLISFTNRKIW